MSCCCSADARLRGLFLHLVAVVVDEHQFGHGKCKKVGYRHAEPYPVQVVGEGKKSKSRKQEEQLAGKRQEDGNLRLSDGLEELGDDYLCSDHGEGGDAEAQGHGGLFRQFVVGGEHAHEHLRENLSHQESEHGDEGGGNHAQFQRMLHTRKELRPVVVSRDGLHAHGDSHHNHDKQHLDAVEDAERADRQVASISQQTVVDEDGDAAGAYVHHERRHPDGEHVSDNLLLQVEAPSFEADVALLVIEMVKHPDHADELREDGGDAGSADSPLEPEDEYGREHDVAALLGILWHASRC